MTVTSKLTVKAKKAPKPEPRPRVPGKRCPNCSQEYVDPDPGDHGTYPGYGTYSEVPHENPFDCIRFLRSELDSVKSDIRDLKSDIRDINSDVDRVSRNG